jgi:hypothetical protein
MIGSGKEDDYDDDDVNQVSRNIFFWLRFLMPYQLVRRRVLS